MIAVEYYPVGIGKHIVCIYDRRNTAADIQTLVGESPNPLFYRKRGLQPKQLLKTNWGH